LSSGKHSGDHKDAIVKIW